MKEEPEIELTLPRLLLWFLCVVVWICLLPVYYLPVIIFNAITGRKVRVWILTGLK